MEYGNGKKNDLIWRSQDNRYHDSGIEEIDFDNENVNIAILGREVEEGAAVLDIGCGEGKLGALLKKKNCRMYGIDLDRSAAQYAKDNYGYQDVFCFNIETEQEKTESERLARLDIKFDYIALLDVLEHVINPTAVLCNALKYLKDGGKLLLSVPNVNNGDIFLNLLRDHFNYQQSGVLDNTHVKYFTKTSFIQWIAMLNSECDFSLDCRPIGNIYGYTEFLGEVKEKYPHVYGFIQLNPSFHTIQHLYILEYHEGKCETPELDKLTDEREPDLIPALEQHLSGKEGNIPEVKLLENERSILEQQINSANEGWKKCTEALKGANDYAAKLEAECESRGSYIEQLENQRKQTDLRIRQLEEEHEKQIKQLEEEYEKRGTYIEKLEADNTELRAYGEHMEHDAIELKQYSEKLEKDIAEMHHGLFHRKK